MMTNAEYLDTPSILNNPITTARPGEELRYAQLTALEKRDYLFDEGIRATAYGTSQNGDRPGVIGGLVQFGKSALGSIADHLLSQSLTRVSDELEEPKPKLFHTYGTTAKIVFTPEPDTVYTGIFSEQAHGLARFSYAGPVMGIGVVPGLGMKFPVNGDHPSQNLVVMRKLDRQQPFWRFFSLHSHNSVFQNPFTNILPAPALLNLVMRTVRERFETVVKKDEGLHLSLENLASVHGDGSSVPKDEMAAPYRAVFRPTTDARAASNPRIDFRDDLAQNIKKGTRIYEVLALSQSREIELGRKRLFSLEELMPHAKKIGAITTASEFIASKYGDYRLFFKHSDQFIRSEYRN